MNDEFAKTPVLDELIKAVLSDFKESDYSTAILTIKSEHCKSFKRFGFNIIKEGKNWSDMEKAK